MANGELIFTTEPATGYGFDIEGSMDAETGFLSGYCVEAYGGELREIEFFDGRTNQLYAVSVMPSSDLDNAIDELLIELEQDELRFKNDI